MPRVREKLSHILIKNHRKVCIPMRGGKGAALHAFPLLGEVDALMLFDVTPF